MKSLGIIGGVGPETTADFYMQVIQGCQDLYEVHRPWIVFSSIPYSYELENDEIINATISEHAKVYLTTEAKNLEKVGVDFICLPCNTLHYYIKEIRESVKIPVLSIVEETIAYMHEKGYKKVGLLSTSATVKYKIYETVFEREHINFITPNSSDMSKIDQIISRITNGEHSKYDTELLESIIATMEKDDIDAVVLACTDLQVLKPKSKNIPVFDTMKVLADASVKKIGE